MELNAITNLDSGNPVDWPAFYVELQKNGHVPDASRVTIEPAGATFRGMFLDLADIRTKILDSGVSPVLTTIYADVLRIPDSLNWLLKTAGLVIYARRIEVAGKATIILDYRSSTVAQLVVFAREMEGALAVSAARSTPEPPVSFNITQSNLAPGVCVQYREGMPILQPLSLDQGMPFQVPEDWVIYLNNAFIFASLLYDQKPQLAWDIFLWVKGWAAQSPMLEELFYRSTSLAVLLSAQLNASANGAAFVPYLSPDIYSEKAKAFVAFAQQYEQNYQKLSTENRITDEAKSMAQALAADAESEVNYVEALLEQANGNYNHAVEAVNAAQLNFNEQNRVVLKVAADFENIGLPDYKRKVIEDALFDLAKAVVTFGAAIASMAVGDGAAAPAAAAGAVKSAEAVAAAATTAQDVAKTASTLAATMKKLKTLVEMLQKVYELAKSVKTVADKIQSAQAQMKIIQDMKDTTDGADLSAADGWAVYKIQADNVLTDPVTKGIGYASDYKEAVDILVVYGQSLSAAQLAVIKAGQQSAALSFQKYYAEQKRLNMRNLVQGLVKDEALNLTLMQQFYQRYLDGKSSLFAALKAYQASYFYWALRESDVRPQIVDPVTNLDSGIQTITQLPMDKAKALEQFNPAPQDMKNVTFVCQDPVVLRQLQSKGRASWVVPLNMAPGEDLANLERVRLSTVRVWLEGVVSQAPGQHICVSITNSGNYLDRYKGKNYQFTCKPLDRPFRYTVAQKPDHSTWEWQFDNGALGMVQLDGRVDTEVEYAYFEPTPFAEWTISLPQNDNPGLDYSKVSKITMEFAGSAIGTHSAGRSKPASRTAAYA